MKVVAIIPARMGSSRFPGKPLAEICGLTMIEHVYRRTAACKTIDAVWVATCDREIQEVAEEFGGKVIMTSSLHQRASDRVAEAAGHIDAEIVVMVQGDEPMIRPEMIELAVAPFFDDPKVGCVNLIARIKTLEEWLNPNTIKIVMDQDGNALYFSREPIPTRRLLSFENISAYKQVCVIPFRREMLFKFSELSPTPLERAESIDMLRLLENGYGVRLVESVYETYSVDTMQDLLLVEEKMAKDALFSKYARQALE